MSVDNQNINEIMLILPSLTRFSFLLQKAVRVRLKNISATIQNAGYATDPYTYHPNNVYIREEKDKDLVHITLPYSNPINSLKKLFSFQRTSTEMIDESLKRMESKIIAYIKKKQSDRLAKSMRKIGTNVDTIQDDFSSCVDQFTISLVYADGKPIPAVDWQTIIEDTSNLPGYFLMKVGNETFQLLINYPFVSGGKLPSCIMSGYPCYPLNVNFQYTTRDECVYRWYKGRPKLKNPNDRINLKWTQCGESFDYIVSPDDVNYILKVEIIPKRNEEIGPAYEIYSRNAVVEDTIGERNVMKRHSFTPTCLPNTGNQFRIISYNLLADFYAKSEYSRTELFPYCSPFALTIDYRQGIFLQEIRGYHSDVICLQELDLNVYDDILKGVLQTEGFSGHYLQKGHLPEGLATIYNTHKFDLVQTYSLVFGKDMSKIPCLKKLYERIQANTKLCKRMEPLPVALQLTLLRSKVKNKYLLVSNTHLYSQLDAAHIRLLQVGLAMEYIKEIREVMLSELNCLPTDFSIIFCGDLNSVPERGVRQFMLSQSIPGDHEDFKSNVEEAVTNVTLKHQFNFKPAYDTNVYTNFTVDFKGCLDYIYYDADRLKLLQTVPMPSEEVLTVNDALPSIHFPSDHLALVADLEWL